MTPLLSSVLRVCRDVRFRRVGDESVVVKQSAGEVLVLNGVAGRVLELVDGARPLGAILDTLGGEYEVDRDTLEREVISFADALERAGLVEAALEGADRA